MTNNLKPTYGQRRLLNGREIHEHYFGDEKPFENTYHVTVMYSSKPIDRRSIKPDESTILVSPKSEHLIFGKDHAFVVLPLDSMFLRTRFHILQNETGASFDFPEYTPHITIGEQGEDFKTLDPYTGPIELGPEEFEDLQEY